MAIRRSEKITFTRRGPNIMANIMPEKIDIR
jgi:hypothetical protein